MSQIWLKPYPVGLQTFEVIRKENYLYIDKTEYVYQMTHSASKYVFLGRPRRFGKSLLASTLRAYFEGKAELFKGLAMERLEKEWKEYPVLHLDMSSGKHRDSEGLNRYLHDIVRENEIRLGIAPQDQIIDANLRLKNLILAVFAKTGRPVVVLVDEYDSPLLDVVHEDENLPGLRNVMRNFYSPLKACEPCLRFVFLTGITKFSQMSIFSELNNMEDISMDKPYAAICGITEEEMRTQMKADIEDLSVQLQISVDETLQRLKDNYDGYHFAWPSPDIYNPYSLLNAFHKKCIAPYWFGTGTPTTLIEMMRKFHVLPQQIGRRMVGVTDFDTPTERIEDISALLYQSGYLTIKDYSPLTELYLLDIPNKEVRIGLYRNLLSNYVKQPAMARTLVAEMYEHIYFGRMDEALKLMQTVLSTIPYCDNTAYEGHYQQLPYLLFSLLGYYTDVEVRTPHGRVDVVMRTATALYVIEVKLDKSAEIAMDQINLKNYPERFALCNLPVVKVGINFDREKRTLSSWMIEKA